MTKIETEKGLKRHLKEYWKDNKDRLKRKQLTREVIERLGIKYITTENFGFFKHIEYFSRSVDNIHYVLYWHRERNIFWFLETTVPLKDTGSIAINLRNYFKGTQTHIIDGKVFNSLSDLEAATFKYLSPGECCVNFGVFKFGTIFKTDDPLVTGRLDLLDFSKIDKE